MRVYTIHIRRHALNPDNDIVLVKEGFSWPAFFFGCVWALRYRLWLAAAVLLAAMMAIGAMLEFSGADPVTQLVAALAYGVVVGTLANDLRRWKLDRGGFAAAGVATGADRESALGRYLDSDPALASELGP